MRRTEPPSAFELTWTRDTVSALLNDPTVSLWLKEAVLDLSLRDPVDAVHDTELLCALMQARCEAVLHPLTNRSGS